LDIPSLVGAVPQRPDDLGPAPKNLLDRVGLVPKISARSYHSIISLSTFSQGQTDTQIPYFIEYNVHISIVRT
jgi:hypothetical protein